MTQALWAQTPVSIQMWATDGSGLTDTVKLAVHPSGTTGVDCVSPSLCEAALPPAPQGFEIRVATSVWDAYGVGSGSYTSIHHLTFDTQTDTFKIQYQIDPSRTGIDFTWPAGLSGVGAGLWRIIPDPIDADGITFSTVDMTAGTTFHINVPNSDPHWIYVIKGDGKKMRSFGNLEIAAAVDSKGKHAGEKRKNYGAEGNFTLPNTTTPPSTKTDLHIEWSAGLIDDATLSISPSASHVWADAPKNSKLDITFTAPLPDGGVVTIFAKSLKSSKQLQAKKYWWTVGGVVTPPKTVFVKLAPSTGDRLLLKMPNINNIGEELFLQTAFGVDGITVGNNDALTIGGKPATKKVIHPKWKTVIGSLDKKDLNFQTGPADWLNQLGGKDITKILKGVDPSKYSNVLLGEAIALNFNIGASDFEKTPTGFGNLHYRAHGGDPAGFNNMAVSAIRDSLNYFMTHGTSSLSSNAAAWASVLNYINTAFSGTFDTANFGGPTLGGHPKTNGTVAKGVKAVADVAYLYRTSLLDEVAPHNYPNIEVLEAVPQKFSLAQNYPNPFNPTTTIEFSLKEDAMVSVVVYNMLGQQVAVLANNEQFDAGVSELTMDASRLASGVYYYRLIVNDGQFQEVKKMMLMK
jgi:hypothetical protein